jgi:NTE family protein
MPGSQKAPKIGLVLSGGGARGIAHIGVLRWFEEHRIPVHYLSGTSMGGLIGGLYAMGKSPAEMLQIINAIDWTQALGAGPTYKETNFRRKEDKRQFQIDFELGLKNGVSLPTGLSSAHYIGLLFDRLTLPYWNIKSFDELPIPFRCMATDFIKGQQVVLQDGSLSSALRATMSIPGAFPPVERDGKILVDGGLLNNIPTPVMKEFKPDVIIAVDIGTPLGDRKSVSSLGGILGQSTVVMTIENDRRNLPLADIVIAPDLGKTTTLDFSVIDPVAEMGYKGAELKKTVLEKFSLDEAAWQQHLAARRARQRADLPVPDRLEITGVEGRAKGTVEHRLEPFAGQPLETQKLETALTKFTGEGRYESLNYGFVAEPGAPDKAALAIRVKEKSYAPPTLSPGIDIDASDLNDINFTIGARLTLYDVGLYGSEWRNDVNVGYQTLFQTEYYKTIGYSGFFFAPRANYQRGTRKLYQGDQQVAEYLGNRTGGGLDIGYGKRRSELRVGYSLTHLSADVKTGDPNLAPVSGNESTARVRWVWEGVDSALLPSRGLRFATEGRMVFDAPNCTYGFPQMETAGSYFVPMSRRTSIVLGGGIGTTFNKDAPVSQQFLLGGPLRLGAYKRQEFAGNHYLLARAGLLHKIAQLPPLLGGKVDALAWWEAGNAFHDFSDVNLNHQLTAGIAAETKIGILSFSLAWGEGGRVKGQFTLGRIF